MNGESDSGRRTPALNLLQRRRERDVTEAAATILLGNENPHEPEIRKLLNVLAGKSWCTTDRFVETRLRDAHCLGGDPDAASQVYSDRFAWFFGDERLQQLIEQGQSTVDTAQRNQVYADLQQHMWDQAWHIPLYNSDFSLAHTAKLQGLVVQPNVLRTDFFQAELVS